LLATPAFDGVVAVTRRPLDLTDARLNALVTSFDQLPGQLPVNARAALCALGTTIAQAGSQQAFRQVDHDAVLAFARWARAGGASTFVLVSSVGASAAARTFYLRVKGEAEDALARVGFPRLVILRPGLLLGQRRDPRPGEAVAQKVVPWLNPLLAGRLRRYRSISAQTVANAMVSAATSSEPRHLLWEHDEIAAAGAG
jgi:uncharacterized protein YbjT (DUF2867 family)